MTSSTFFSTFVRFLSLALLLASSIESSSAEAAPFGEGTSSSSGAVLAAPALQGDAVDGDELGSSTDPTAQADRDELPLDLCEGPGSVGWGGVVFVGGTGQNVPGLSSPQECCQTCVANPNCIQWLMRSGSECQLNVAGNDCNGSTLAEPNSGQIRCPTP